MCVTYKFISRGIVKIFAPESEDQYQKREPPWILAKYYETSLPFLLFRTLISFRAQTLVCHLAITLNPLLWVDEKR